ncbi:hypothetical protein A9Q81_22540 [Gammaproteobacteria bacterium 42_54_T18]|nr:hypothetical protein A9Q81_22540 [Gammaproteobacteria bacterium 42_54_T18]
MRFNINDAAKLYAELAPIILQDDNLVSTDKEISNQLIDGIESLIQELGLPTTLREMKIDEKCLPNLAQDAMLQQRLLVNNPCMMKIIVFSPSFKQVIVRPIPAPTGIQHGSPVDLRRRQSLAR